MANQPSDRQRMRNDLRELAKLASPGNATHGFDTADSSGYVDLSAYSARDPDWIERELARAKKGAPPPPPPRPGSRGIDALTPSSMAPVALEAFVVPDDTARLRPSRGKRVLYGVLGLASAGVVAFLAVTLAKHPPPPDKTQTAAAVTAPPATDPVSPPATTAAAAAPSTVAPTSDSTAPSAAPATATTATTSKAASSSVASAPSSKKKAAPAARVHAAAAVPAASPAPVHAAAVPAARPAAVPASKPAGGGDSLMDLIKKSVATGK